MDDAVLNSQILFDEFSRIGIVRQNSAYLGRVQEYIFGPLGSEERLDRRLLRGIQLCMGTGYNIDVTGRLQSAHDRRTHQASMAGDIDSRVEVHLSTHR